MAVPMKIILIEHHRYDSALRVGSHHFAREFRKLGHRVIWVSHPRSWLHRVRERPRPLRVEHDDGVVEITPRVTLPYVNLPLLNTKTWGKRWINRRVLKPLKEEMAGGCDILWISDFTMLSILDHMAADLVVLRVFDRLDQFAWMPRTIFDLLLHYQNRADLTIASSKEIVALLAQSGIDAHYVPNGAHIRTGLTDVVGAASPSNRIIYVGSIDSWFDVDAVEYWAEALPEMVFEIAGPNRLGLTSCQPNLSYVGPISYERLPEWILGAQFGLIPFKMNKLTRGIHPIKLYDYLSCGCPVLSAALPEVTPHRQGVLVYRDKEEGLELLRSHINRDFDRGCLWRLASRNSWTQRLQAVFDLLDESHESKRDRDFVLTRLESQVAAPSN